MKIRLVLFSILIFQCCFPSAPSADSAVKVGIYSNEPIIFIDSDGKGKGFFADIIEYVASKEGWQIEYVPGTWQQCLSRLENNQIDILGVVAFSKARDKLYDFNKETLLTSWAQLYTPVGSDIKTIADVAGKKVAVLKEDIHYSAFTQILDSFGIESEIIETMDYQIVLDLVSRGQADAGIVNRFFGMRHGRKYRVDKSGVIFNPIKIFYAVPEGKNEALIAAIDRYVSLLKGNENSVFYRSLDKWFGTVSTGWALAEWIKWALVATLGLVVLLFLGNIVLRNQVSSKTKALTNELNRRKKAEETLRESEKRFRDLSEMLPEAVFETDQYLNLTYANRRAFELFGYSPQELKRLNGIELLAPEDRDRAKESLSLRLKGTDPGTVEYQGLKKDGSVFPVLFHANSIMNKGELFGVRGIIIDLSERKQAEKEKARIEDQYRQAQKMESVGRLAGGVAHDYNNVLHVIMGFAELAMGEVDSTDPLWTNLDGILTAARRARDVTRQLLAFARKQTIAPKVLDLNENVESMLKMLRRLIGEDIDLAWLPGKGLWPVKLDPSQIDQILANLCVNARDAIEDVGKVTIETGYTTFDAAYCADHAGFVPGEFVLLAVSDNGCGIDQEMLGNIFEPFFTTKEVDKGTGLGLAMVYGIVKQNNGFINVYSESGKGTTIKIYLPRYEGKIVEIQEESKTEIQPGHGETILLVEDDLSILKLTRTILEGLGYIVLTADTPGKAMSLAEEHADEVHLLIADVIMPEMNGPEMAERLQSLYPDLKCLFMSGYTANAIAHHGVLDEGVQFIQKPFSKSDLATIVRKVLGEA